MKKDFKTEFNVPALDFMSADTLGKAADAKRKTNAAKAEPAAQQQTEPAAGNVTSSNKARRKRKEIKNRRVQLVIKPSLFDRMSDFCEEEDISINSYIEALIKHDLEGRKI